MACHSFFTACQIIYIPTSNGKGLLSHFFKLMISDLFERAASKEARLRRSAQSKQTEQVIKRRSKTKLFLNWAGTILVLMVAPILLLLGTKFHLALLATLTLYLFTLLLPRVYSTFPGSFSFGEGCLALQGFLLLYFEGIASIITHSDDPTSIPGSFSIIAKAGYLSCLSLCILPLIPTLHWTGKTAFFLACGCAILLGLTIPYLWWTLKRDPIFWILGLILESNNKCLLMALWVICVIGAIILVRVQKSKATTRTRKLFHALMVIVCTSGISLDPDFTYLASVVAFCVFALLESLRFHKIDPFHKILDSSFEIFLDEKDSGGLILTHIYLLIGCCAPLWLAHDLSFTSKEKLLSGVLAIGIGDSAASIVGSLFGKLRFPDSQKSIEGTLASVMAQLLFLGGLQKLEVIQLEDWSSLYLPIFIASLAEALTTQVDNLVLPLVLYSLL